MKTEFLNLLVKSSVPAIVLIALGYFRKSIRIAPDRFKPGEIEELDERFRRVIWILVFCMVAVGVGFTFGAHAALVGLNRYFATRHPSDLQLFPQPAIWWFFPAFGALAMSWEITLQLWGLVGDRKTADLYSDWSNVTRVMGGWSEHGMDSRRVLRLLSLLIALPIGIFTVLAIPMHASIGPDSIVDCGYGFKGCAVFKLADARRITSIQGFRNRDEELIARAGLVVDFDDGRRWSSADWGDFKKKVDPEFAALLILETGLPIGDATTKEEIQPLPSANPDLTR